MKKFLTVLALGSTMVLLQACNTVRGAGQDIDSAADCVDGVKGNC